MSKIFCILTSLIVFIFFFHTIGYSWKNFDESIIFRERVLPIPKSFSEIFEIISLFGLNNHFEACNPIYSNISNIRGTPVDVLFCLFIFSLFKKSSVAYHLFILIFHLLNSILCFLIINKISLEITNEKSTKWLRLTLVLLLTLIWALHPVNVESVIFVTNIGALVTYFFCFLLIFYFMNLKRITAFHFFLTFFLYLFPLFLNEYSVTLPIILFFLAYLRSSFSNAIKSTSPMFLALVIFIFYFFSLPIIRTTQESNFAVTLERIFWLSPQIFFHYLKLVLLPINLSIDQTAFVKLGNTLFDPYAIFCSLFMFFLILFSIFFLIFSGLTQSSQGRVPLAHRPTFGLRSLGYPATAHFLRKSYFLILFIPFFLSLLPFLHIISPIYNLASERYLYFPLFLLIFGLSHFLFSIFRRGLINQTPTFVILFIILIIFGTRSYIRTSDWKDSITLLKSSANVAPNNLYKGLRKYMMVTSSRALKEEGSKIDPKKCSEDALSFLNKALKDFQTKKLKYQDKIPTILKFYGLDPETLEAKTAYLISFIDMDINQDPNKALSIFSPYAKNLQVLDTLILNFYYQLLFNTKNFDEAERILHRSLTQNKISPDLYVALSDFYEYKYHDLKLTEMYLNKSFKYFPYDSLTLFGLVRLYKSLNNAERFAYYSGLLGYREHSPSYLQDACIVYIALKKKEEAIKVLKKLLRDHPNDEMTKELQTKFIQVFEGM